MTHLAVGRQFSWKCPEGRFSCQLDWAEETRLLEGFSHLFSSLLAVILAFGRATAVLWFSKWLGGSLVIVQLRIFLLCNVWTTKRYPVVLVLNRYLSLWKHITIDCKPNGQRHPPAVWLPTHSSLFPLRLFTLLLFNLPSFLHSILTLRVDSLNLSLLNPLIPFSLFPFWSSTAGPLHYPHLSELLRAWWI